MIRKRVTTFLYLIISIAAWSVEEAYIELKAKNLRDTFFMIYYDYENDIPYIGIKSLIDFLEIKTLELEEEKNILKGKLSEEQENIQISIPNTAEGIPEDDIYLTLEQVSEILKIKEYRWEPDSLRIELMPEYKLTYEILREAEQRIKKLENQKGEEERYIDIYGKKRFLAPGILKLDYNNWNIKEDSNNFKIEYGTQLFYGDFYIGQSITPKQKLDTVTLEYKNFLNKEGNLLLGDSYLQLGEYYDMDRDIRGITYTKEDIVAYSRNNEIVISGRVIGAKLVELLQNNSLLDYIRMNGQENYSFTVKSASSFSKYSVKIYYEDGRIDVREVNILSSSKILKQGTSDYSFQIGETVGKNHLQQQYSYRYGILQDLTLGGAFVKGESEEYPVQSIEGEIIYRIQNNYIPTVLDLKILNEKNDSRPSYIARTEHQISDVGIIAEYEQFGPALSEIQGYNKYYNLGINKNFGNFSFNLGGEKEIAGKESQDLYYLNIGYNGFTNINLYMYNQYEVPKNFSESYNLEFRAVYSGIDFLSIVAETSHIFYQNQDMENEYYLKINRRIMKESSFRDIDLGLDLGYNKKDGYTLGINMTWYFDRDGIYFETPITHIGGETQLGLRAQKAFILEKPSGIHRTNPKNVSDTWIEGTAFLDTNGNGIQDNDEESLQDVEIIIGTERAVTDSKGRYILTNLSAHSLHTVEVAGDTIDAMMKPKYEYRTVKPAASTGVTVDIPIAPVSIVSGEIKIEGISEKNLFRILAKSEIHIKRDGETIMKSTPEFDGYYYIEDVLPGEYQIEYVYKGGESLTVDKKILELQVKPGAEGQYYENFNFYGVIPPLEDIEEMN